MSRKNLTNEVRTLIDTHGLKAVLFSILAICNLRRDTMRKLYGGICKWNVIYENLSYIVQLMDNDQKTA